jgi:3-oxoacyl-[acyl-carrier protein] reductase
MGQLEGKAAIVTGGSRGIGRGVALAFAAEGADVAVNYSKNKAEAEAVAAEIRAMGRRALCFQMNVAESAQVNEMVKSVAAQFGKVDILVNNAGVTRPAMLHKMTDEQWDEVLAVHLKGTFNGIRAAAPLMMEQRSGKIINVTSTAGLTGTVGQANYSAAKGGIVVLTKSAARELGRYGINVNCISLGVVETDMSKKLREDPKLRSTYEARIVLGRFAKVEDVVAPFVFFASRGSDYVTGQTLSADGGTVL